MSVGADGSRKKTLLPMDTAQYNGYPNSQQFQPNAIAYNVYSTTESADHFYVYESGAVKESNAITIDTFGQFYPTFLQSPSGQQQFWYEPRDGKNSLFLGDKDAKNEKEIGTLTDYVPYGWYTDDYLLAQQNGSELYVFGAGDLKGQKPLKISDYHKPSQDSHGLGAGYGGL
jgi:hypothetical protein